MSERADDLEYPPCEADYLVRWLFDVGPAMSGGMGPSVLTHSELLAWQSNTGIELTAWETKVLRGLSMDFLSMSDSAKSPSCPPPWTPEPVEARDVDVAKRIKEALRG